jgi:eukaryotic-like serine/threonine-protein kinase
MPKTYVVKRVVRAIDRGGMGAVEEVELTDGTRCARKTFDPDPRTWNTPDEHAKLRKRFDREVRYQIELGEIGALPILHADLSADPPWFLMPLADKSYEDQIEEDRNAKKISPQPLMDILSGLEQMHELGYVHRDLKPSNVLLHNGTWKLSDFGLAAKILGGKTSRFTDTNSAWGTEDYCSPEQIQDFKNAKGPTDMYAFGCILHELVDGSTRIPYAVQRAPNTQYDYIIKKCTETDVAKRFKTIGGLRAVLAEELRNDPSLSKGAVTDSWAAELPNIAQWDTKRVNEFVTHIEAAAAGNELHAVAELQEQHLEAFANAAPDEWEAFAEAYCEWAGSSFTFTFCDVVGGCLRAIFNNPASTVTVQANAAVAMALLASKNDRWYCMRLLKPLTDSTISAQLAQRIAIEIRANDLAQHFEHCAKEVFGWDRTDYHPKIVAALDDAKKKVDEIMAINPFKVV